MAGWRGGGGERDRSPAAILAGPEVAVERLDGVADCWGQVVADERYVIVGNLVG